MSRVLVLGGSRSGKSAHAESLVAGAGEVVYLATSPPVPGDAEWAQRKDAEWPAQAQRKGVELDEAHRPPKRPWEEIDAPEAAAKREASGPPPTKAEQDMELIRSKRASTAGGTAPASSASNRPSSV